MTTTTVPSIAPVKPEVHQKVVDLLEDLLVMAKAGDFNGFAWVAVGPSRMCYSGFSVTHETNCMSLLGEIACLQRDFMDENLELRRKPLEEYCE